MMKFSAGDLLIFYGRDFVSRTIEYMTRGPSHIGIVSPIDCPHETLALAESTTKCDEPDLISGRKRFGVQFHAIQRRIDNYPGRVCRMTLAPSWTLDARESESLAAWLWGRRMATYNMEGAVLSGTRLFKWTELLPYPDLNSLFCSELCAAVLMRLHRMPLRNPSFYNPASLVREVRRCGIYGAPELCE